MIEVKYEKNRKRLDINGALGLSSVETVEVADDAGVALAEGTLCLHDEGCDTALAEWAPSKDGRHLAHAIQDGGSDWRTIRVLEVTSGRLLADAIKELPKIPLPYDKWEKMNVKMISSVDLFYSFKKNRLPV